MRAPVPLAGRRSWHRAPRLFPVVATLAALAALVGCAAPARIPARIEVPPELPFLTNDQFFEMRWALQREPSVTRAVGRVKPSFDSDFRLTLALFGLDAEGRIASRGTTYLQSEFSRQAVPFAVELTPTGREARYELRVVDYYLTGMRAN